MDLSLNIRAFVAQRLIPMKDGKYVARQFEYSSNSPAFQI